MPASSDTGVGSSTGGASASHSTRASIAVVGASASGAVSTSPRESDSSPTPERFTAQRVPGCAISTATPWLWSPRTRARRSSGSSVTAIADAQRAADQRARDDRPEAAHLEAAVDRQARRPRARRARRRSAAASAPSAARSASSPAPVTDDTRTIGAPASGVRASSAATSSAASSATSVVHGVDLRERDHRARDAEQLADREVLARLRHHALVGGDHEQQQIDAGGARHHRAHEPLVAGHVDHAEPGPVGQVERREAELDRDPARLLLGQPVGVDAGERAARARSCRGRCGRRCRGSSGTAARRRPA